MKEEKQTPRVLHLDSSHEWGGGQNQVRLLMRELAQRDVSQLCLTPTGSPLAERLGDMNLPVKQIAWHGGADPRALWQVFNAINDFDIVHCHDAHALQIALMPARMRGVKVVAARRVPFKTNPTKWNRSDVIIAVSEHVRGVLIANGVQPECVRVVHSGTDAEETRNIAPLEPRMRAQLNVPADAFVVGNAAQLIPLKGHMIIPAAAGMLPGVHWFIAGEGPTRGELELAIAQHDVADRVHLLGWIPEARRLFKEIDAYLSASTEDGLGNSITESRAMGVPVLSANGGGGAEIMQPVHERTGAVLYTANDPRALADAVLRLRQPDVRARVLAAQEERFPDFDIRRTAAQTFEVYQELME
ncbi:MAG TPA: glycosyltransferase family 4 protein [Longimicrobiales bacterium]